MTDSRSETAELLLLGAKGCVYLSGFGLIANLFDYFSDKNAPEITNIATGEAEKLEGAEPLIPIGLAMALGLIAIALAIASVIADRATATAPPTPGADAVSPSPGPPPKTAGADATAGGSSAGPAVSPPPSTEPARAPRPSSIQRQEVDRARRGEIYAVVGLAITIGQIIVGTLF